MLRNFIIFSVLLTQLLLFQYTYGVEPEIVAEINEGTDGFSIADDALIAPFGPPMGRPVEICRIAASNDGDIYLYRKQIILKVIKGESLIEIYSPGGGNWITELFIDTLAYLYAFEPTHKRGPKYNTREVHKLTPDGEEILFYSPYFYTRHDNEWELNWLPDGTLYFHGGQHTYNIYSPNGELVASDQKSASLYKICSDSKIYVVHRIEDRANPAKVIELFKVGRGESIAEIVENSKPLWFRIFDHTNICSITDEGILIYNINGSISEYGYLINGFMVPLSKIIKEGKNYKYNDHLSVPVQLPEIHKMKLPDGQPEYLNQGLDYTKFAGKGQLVHTRHVFVANNGDVYQVLQVWTYGALVKGVDKMVILRWKT